MPFSYGVKGIFIKLELLIKNNVYSRDFKKLFTSEKHEFNFNKKLSDFM